MNLALIIAGGCGERMGCTPPKQFIKIAGHPVLAYTLKKFQDHHAIDAICVVALAGWESYVREIAETYNLTKLRHITTGGKTGQESIFNGLAELQKHYAPTDFVLIHDAVRPIIPDGIIDDAIKTATKYGNAVSATPCFEALTQNNGTEFITHQNLYRAQAPQCFELGKILDTHNRAQKQNITNSITSATLMMQMGEQIFFCRGSNKNIKLTTPEDFEIFQAILNNEPDEYNFNN